jgi:phycobilisome core-membrane linker protein
LLDGKLSVRAFVRALASSPAYEARFCTPYPAPKAAELLCRHLLGRTPATPEMAQYEELLSRDGLEATVTAIVESAEYVRYFGEEMVPYKRS